VGCDQRTVCGKLRYSLAGVASKFIIHRVLLKKRRGNEEWQSYYYVLVVVPLGSLLREVVSLDFGWTTCQWRPPP